MPISKNLGLDLPSQYQIHELVFINSGSSYYTRLPVNEHAALLADNNQGKTSTLSAMKLFLLPEISFKRTESKFGFHSGGKAYSDLDSYRYYFPSNESYIICHAENPKLQFCWVLYRTSNLEYERIAVPKSYNEIEHLFWRNKSNKNGCAGELQSDIASTSIRKILLSRDYGGQLFNDRSRIGEAIYTRTSTQDDHTKFSLLPMTKKATKSSIETVRSLLTMAFDLGNASTTSLPSAISSIIDGLGMSAVRNEGVIIDLETQIDEWNDLKQQDTHISNIEANQPIFEIMQSNKKEYDSLKIKVTDDYISLRNAVDLGVEKISLDLKAASEEAENAKQSYERHGQEHQQLVKAISNLKSDIRNQIKQIDINRSAIQIADEARGQLRPLLGIDKPTDPDFLSYLEGDIKLCESDIQAIENQTLAAQQLKNLHLEIQSTIASIEKVSNVLKEAEQGHGLLDQLTHHSAFVLDNLNRDFATLPGGLNLEQLSAVDCFTALFTTENSEIYFCDQKLNTTPANVFDKAKKIQALKDDIAQSDNHLESMREREAKLQDSMELNEDDRKNELERHRSDLQELKDQHTCLSACAYALKRLQEEEASKEINEEKLADLQGQVDESSIKLLDLRDKYDELQQKPSDLMGKASLYNECLNNIKNIEAFSNGLLSPDHIDSEASADYIEADRLKLLIEGLSTDMYTANQHREACRGNLSLLLERGVITVSPDERYATTRTDEMVDDYYTKLSSLYVNLPQHKENYGQRLNAHNNTAAASARMIENVKGIIESFTDNINQEITGYTVSNLEGVKLHMKLDPQYLSLKDSLSRMSTSENTLLSEDFYKQIQSFQKRFYSAKTGKIDITSIIEKIDYHYRISGEWEDKPQSNGTNSMVSAMLLAILFKRMVPEDLNLSIPVIFDEAGKLDEKNLSEVLRLVDDHGLTLFAANPENTGSIAEVLGIYHDLASFKTIDVDVIGKCEIIYYPGMEDRLEDVPPVAEEVVTA